MAEDMEPVESSGVSDVAEYLEKMAEQKGSRRTPDESEPTVGDASREEELR